MANKKKVTESDLHTSYLKTKKAREPESLHIADQK